jgi:hypothetical protein
VCEILLENGADVDHADKEGKTALFAAASMGHLQILNILLFWGCYVDGIGGNQCCGSETIIFGSGSYLVGRFGFGFDFIGRLIPRSGSGSQSDKRFIIVL